MEILREILLEMHEQAIDIDINSNSNNANNNNDSSLYLSTSNSILVLDLDRTSSSSSSSSSLVVSKSLQIVHSKSISIMSTTYIPLAQCFVSILSDSSLLLVSDTLSPSSSLSDKIVFPIQPKKVIDLHDKGIAIICNDDRVFQFKLIDITTKISIPSSRSKHNNSSNSSSSSKSNSSIIIGNSNHITIVDSNTKNMLTLLSWQPSLLSSLSLSTGTWLADGSSTSIVLNDNEAIVVCRSSSHDAYSFYILLVSPTGGRLIKLDAKGDVLYERVLSTQPTDLLVRDDKLWIVSKTGIDIWDGRYGVSQDSFSFNAPVSSASIVLPYNNNSYQYICCLSSKTSSSTSIVRHIITIQGNDDSSLCKAIGKLASVTTATINDNKRKVDAVNNKATKKKAKTNEPLTEESDTDFLIRIDKTKGTDIKASEWNKMRVLINKKIVSLKVNSNLIEEAARAGRADILAFLALQITDLTERDAVRILQAYLLIPSSAIKNLKAHKGALVWTHDDDKKEDDTKDKKKKKDESKQQNLTELSLLALLIQPLLQRRSSFAPQLLTDAARRMRPQFAILLLRLFMNFMKGLSESLSLKSSQVLELEERQVLRSIDWTEAIMDAHFPAITFSYRQEPTVYKHFLTVAPGAEEISLKIEKILGICTHIEKIADIPAHQHIVQKSLYLVESLNI